MYRLISATPSPYARKVRVALLEKGIPFELVTEVPWNTDTQTPRFNPLEKLPILIDGKGESTYESRFILEVLELRHPEPPLYPKPTDELIAAKKVEALADGVCDAFVLSFFERRRECPSAEWLARQGRKIDGGLAEIARLVGERTHAVGDRFTIADIAAVTAVGYLDVRAPEHPWRQRHPTLASYHDRLATRPSFRATTPVPQTIRDRVV